MDSCFDSSYRQLTGVHNFCTSLKMLISFKNCCIMFLVALFLVLPLTFVVTQNSRHELRKARHILELSQDEKLNFINSFDLVLSDIDGVLWTEAGVIDRSGEAFNKLKSNGKKCAFVTNNSVRTASAYQQRFKEAGIEVDLEEIIHPLKSIVDYLKKIDFNGRIYCLANTLFKNGLKEAGFDVIEDPSQVLNETFHDLGKYIFDREKPDAVIVDVDFNLSAPKLIRAHRYLTTFPNCIFIAGASDMLLPIREGVEILGPGPYIKLLAEASKKEPILLGKPGLPLSNLVLDKFNIKKRDRVLMVGDMLEQDIGFGKNCSFQTLLVLSGGAKQHDLDILDNPDEIPDFYANKMSDFLQFFEDLNNNKSRI